ncbi:MAG: histidine kinase [Blastocatellia bacterium]|nr:histidine kinase [Blastocatellia bacterium]
MDISPFVNLMQSSIPKANEYEIESRTSGRQFGLKLLLIFCFWTLFGLLYATQYYFGLNEEEAYPSWWLLVLWQLSVYYAWGVLTPIILWLGHRFPIERAQWVRSLLIHIFAGTILSAVHKLAYTTIHRIIDLWPRWSIDTFIDQYIHFLFMFFHTDLFMYFAILGISLAFDYYHKYRERELQAAKLRTELAEAQLQALKNQLHPHFLFNTLNTIVGLIRNNENRAAITTTAGLSELLRHVLENSNKQEVSLREELEFIRQYLGIQQMRFSDRLRLQMEIDPGALDAGVPNLILQPLVENAIIHGIAMRATPGVLAVSARRDNGFLRIEISNDGPQLPEGWQMEKSARIGLANTRARLEHLYGRDFRFDVRSREGGAVATLEIPFRPEPEEAKSDDKREEDQNPDS